MKIMITALLLLLLSGAAHAHAGSGIDEHWHVHTSRLPFAVSDHSATLDPATGKVYLVGGCNSTDGNVRIRSDPPDEDFFICPSVTRYANVFDAKTGRVGTPLPDAPQERYRHAAVFHNNLLWVLGGRDVSDNMVDKVDIFDISTQKWRTDLSFTIPDDIIRSDHAAFVIDDTIYMVGGYTPGYNATATTIAIDIPLSLNSKTSLVYAQRDDMNEARGDCAVAVANGVAYVVGGFTHLDEYKNALVTVERYDPFQNVWELQDELTYGRGDKAVVTVGNKIYVVGGEAKTDETTEVSQRTHPTTEVEVLDTSDPNAVWTEEITDIPADHFRFPAISYDGIIYTFGGQGFYSSDCSCFATKDSILTYDTTEEHGTPESGAIATYVTIVFVFTAMPFML